MGLLSLFHFSMTQSPEYIKKCKNDECLDEEHYPCTCLCVPLAKNRGYSSMSSEAKPRIFCPCRNSGEMPTFTQEHIYDFYVKIFISATYEPFCGSGSNNEFRPLDICSASPFYR